MYYENIKDAKKFLTGNTKKIESKLYKLMISASKNQMFEEAGRLRDRIKSINQIQKSRLARMRSNIVICFFCLNRIDLVLSAVRVMIQNCVVMHDY